MVKLYEILVIDDESNIPDLLNPIQSMLQRRHLNVNFSYAHEQADYEEALQKSFDIILFDNQLNATDYMEISKKSQGFELIKAFRKNNLRTKIIFYSSAFDLENSELIPFKHKDYFEMINELNIFKIVCKRDSKGLMTAIQEAIGNLDVIMTTLEKMENEYSSLGLTYKSGEQEIALKDLVSDFKVDGPISRAFKKDFNEMLATHFLNARIGD